MDRLIEKKKGLRWKHILWIVGGVLFAYMVYYVIFSSNSTAYRIGKEKLTIHTVETGIFDDFISVMGQVEPISTIFLDAIEEGRVEECFIEEGADVKKGDIILRLGNRQLYQTILNSEAALAEKENYLRNTRIYFEAELIQSRKNILDNQYRLIRKHRTYIQNKALFEDDLISREVYMQAKEDYEYEVNLLEINRQKAKSDSLIRVTSMITLEKDLETMRKALALVHERLDNLNVRAPVDGQLGMLEAEIGQLINSGQRIGQINVLTDYKIKALIDEHYIDRVRRELSASFERNNQDFSLIVKKVFPEVREGQFKIDMVFIGEKPDNIRTGQTYYINLQLGQSKEAVLLSKGDFSQNTGGQWIFVLNESESGATKRNIRIGKQNPKYYEVLEGLNPGEKVITSGYEMLGDNDRIVFK